MLEGNLRYFRGLKAFFELSKMGVFTYHFLFLGKTEPPPYRPH